MKLRDISDKNILSHELGRSLSDDEIKSAIAESYEIREPIVEKLKSFGKSQRTKEAWKRNKWGYLKGIKKWHRSVKGKEFHRKLARHLAVSLIPKGKNNIRNKKRIRVRENLDEILKSISSIRTHMYVDLAYYKSILEEIDYSDILEEVISSLNDIELKLIREDYSLTMDEMETLLRLIDPDIIAEEFNVNIDSEMADKNSVYLANLIGYQENLSEDNSYG